MLVLIADDILSDPTRWNELDVLLHHALDKRCYLHAENGSGRALAVWRDSLSPTRQQTWDDASSWSIRDSALFRMQTWVAAAVSDETLNPPRFTLEGVLRRVSLALRIWLENDRNDRRFWLSMMQPDVRKLFLDLEKRGIIEFDSKGGLGELRVALEQRYEKGQIDRHNSSVFFDSDAPVPDAPADDALRMIKLCSDAKLLHHCLSRRAIENYIPKAALYAWVAEKGGSERKTRQGKVDAYWAMDRDQRHHFRLKSGWDKDPSEQVSMLYKTVQPTGRSTLTDGIAADIAKVYDTYNAEIRAWVAKEGMDPVLQATIDQLTDWVRVPYA